MIFKDEKGHELQDVVFELKSTGRGYIGLYITAKCKECHRSFELDLSSVPMTIKGIIDG